VKIQEKTQDMQEPQEKNQDKFKKNFFKEKIEQHKIVQENFSRNIFERWISNLNMKSHNF